MCHKTDKSMLWTKLLEKFEVTMSFSETAILIFYLHPKINCEKVKVTKMGLGGEGKCCRVTQRYILNRDC